MRKSEYQWLHRGKWDQLKLTLRTGRDHGARLALSMVIELFSVLSTANAPKIPHTRGVC